MKPEEKNLKQGAELDEQELDGVTGGLGGFPPFSQAPNTMQFQPGMEMNASTMQYQPGIDPMQAQTLEQKARLASLPKQAKNSGGTHSL